MYPVVASFNRFEDIGAWQKARVLCESLNKIIITSELWKDYKLKIKLIDHPELLWIIAEGFGRGGNAEFRQFLEISHASACETQSQLYRILDRKYITQESFDHLYTMVGEIKKCFFP